ncbi:MAG: BON domain-containing protein [Pseudomonadota bacterium]
MKKSIIVFAVLAAAVGSQVTLAADSPVVPAAAAVNDSRIFVAVKSKLKAEHVDGFSRLEVMTDDNGQVWLKGKLDTQAQADRAVALARETENVKFVHSELVVKTSN